MFSVWDYCGISWYKAKWLLWQLLSAENMPQCFISVYIAYLVV